MPPQWTVSTQRLHLSINIHRSKTEINIAIYKPEWYSQERKQHLLLEFIMNLKTLHVPVKQNLKDWKIIDIVLFLFNVEIVFIKKYIIIIDYGSCNCGHHSLTKLCSPNVSRAAIGRKHKKSRKRTWHVKCEFQDALYGFIIIYFVFCIQLNEREGIGSSSIQTIPKFYHFFFS